ncbi:ubiquitin carboxyl-terminal hydrolase 2-like [Cornus florida]|uniref:ubiquitin carboxyl-terminal hydrolase 2-like n=1 Tax=Cornus florida TaxID=4283 RepID=UPI0028992CC5|nr:ubiquitin carboxyl-terminal hydrolase 2-like [Cornus florida]XP_059651591.1 ubiquitin carboxyl-terminal hydrolase 2-like [Cornus florida]XP_059651600.1 ubiquitin carboxyl-terminal hydrolase 2-like [Cornus florida]XP_059651607.1 ubiquitin carboxyl-terminal hydrolase 2-like [Cornus florida]
MGKKVKKKARSGHKEKRVVAPSLKTDSRQSIPTSIETVDDGVSIVKERKVCPHLDKGVDLVKVSSKIGSSEPIRCQDCRESVVGRRANKGMNKHGKKKGGGSGDPRPESKAIWVCLHCGHFSCGGIGLPTTSQSHAVQHARKTRHPLAVQFENPHLQWCFPCNTLIPVEKSEENGEQRDMSLDIVKMIKGRSSEGASVDVEDVWLGSGKVTSEINSENTVSSSLDGGGGYVVRGLVNLGNTCFFNSITQNLLAMDRLRDYLLKLDRSVGPLTVSLQKLYNETNPVAGFKNVINPRSFFGCVCAKAPQFRGYQQHDSHELLRCLLDGLCTEESCSRKEVGSSQDDEISPNVSPTFVDAIFGGKLSSTVCCLECGHSSTVYEPFLDLSLPVPTKKPPPKKAQPISRGKKSKLPPKRSGRIRAKGNRGIDPVAYQNVSDPPTSDRSGGVQSSVPVAENIVDVSGECRSSESISPNNVASDKVNVASDRDMSSQTNDLSFIQDSINKDAIHNDVISHDNLESCNEICPLHMEETASSLGDFSWLDYVEPGPLSDNHHMASQINDNSVTQNSGNKDADQNDLDSSSQVCPFYIESNQRVDLAGNSWEDELPLQCEDSAVILLPYKEDTCAPDEILRGEGEVSSSTVAYEQDSLDFDGFGDLFNEPETAGAPNVKPFSSDKNFQANEVAGTGSIVGNSDSDPDVVDSDSPVSIDSCLAYFTKPELLSNEHGWHCENCSKALRKQMMKSRKRQEKPTSKIGINGGENKIQNALLGLGNDHPFLNEVRNRGNGNIKGEALSTSDKGLASRNGKVDGNDNCIIETTQKAELNPVACHLEKGKGVMNDALPGLSESSSSYKPCSQASSSGQPSDSSSVQEPSCAGCDTDKVEHGESQLSAERCASEGSDDEETDTDNVKVKRDATKRILIYRSPIILTIHLKRFSQDARGRLSKLNGHVNFEDTIDLSLYMDPRCTEREMYKYRLVGVVEHLGTMRGGHYVAYVRGGTKGIGKAEKENGDFVWYYASDAYVRVASLEEVLRCEAYILFYEKI